MKRFFCALLLCVLALWAAPGVMAQVEEKYVEAVSGVTLSQHSAALFTGRTLKLTATIKPQSRAYETPRWTSENPLVATVQDGVVTALKAGFTRITATCEGVSDTCDITVTDAAVQSFTLDNTQIYLAPGDKMQIQASAFTPEYAANKTLTWESLDPSVALVSANSGMVIALRVGETSVRATSSNGKTALCKVTVTDEIRAQSVTLNKTALTLGTGRAYQLIANVFPRNAVEADRALTFESAKPAIASVDETGLITAGKKAGKTVITVSTANGRKAKCTVTVKLIKVTSVKLDRASADLSVGGSLTLTATVAPDNATKYPAKFTSSKPAIVSVSAQGVVTALAPGSATITASAGAKSDKCVVNVRPVSVGQVTISAAGDITIGGDPRKPASQPASKTYYEKLYKQYGGDFLGNLRSTFSGTNEITLVNLESTLSTAARNRAKTYVFRAEPAYAHILSDASVDVVGHANNHANDFTGGIVHTYNAVRSHDMAYVGNGRTARINVGGVKVGICAFSTFDGTSVAAVRSAVGTLRRNCDLVVLSMHWGAEYSYAASASQKALAHTAVLAGADLVVGHHSHVVSGIEKYRGKYIVYGLGTISSCAATPKDMDTFVFKQTFDVDAASGYVGEGAVELVPCSMSTDENLNDAKPVVLSGDDRSRVLRKIKYYSQAFAQTVPDSAFS